MRRPLSRVLDAAQSATSGETGRVRMRELSGDVTPADVDGNVGGRVATNGDAAQSARLVLGVNQVASDELRPPAGEILSLVLVQ